MNLRKYYGSYHAGVPYYLKPYALFVGILIIRYFKSSDKRLLVILPWMMSSLSLFMFFPHNHYVSTFMFLSSIILGHIVAKVKNKFVLYTIFTACLIGALYNLRPNNYEKKYYTEYMDTIKYILDNSKPDDEVVLLTNKNYNLYQPQTDYYWFGVDNAVIVDLLNNDARYFDLDELIKNKKPKYLSVHDIGLVSDSHSVFYNRFLRYRNSLLWRRSLKYPKYKEKMKKNDAAFFKLDEEWVKKNYERVENMNLLRLKEK